MPEKKTASLPALLLLGALWTGLSGCDIVQQKLGIEDPVAKNSRAESEGKAVGGACRQSGRAIEDCYSIYSWLPKAPIYEGWRDMDVYMRENKLDTVTPQLPPPAPPASKNKKKKPPEESVAAENKPAEKPAENPPAKPAEKH